MLDIGLICNADGREEIADSIMELGIPKFNANAMALMVDKFFINLVSSVNTCCDGKIDEPTTLEVIYRICDNMANIAYDAENKLLTEQFHMDQKVKVNEAKIQIEEPKEKEKKEMAEEKKTENQVSAPNAFIMELTELMQKYKDALDADDAEMILRRCSMKTREIFQSRKLQEYTSNLVTMIIALLSCNQEMYPKVNNAAVDRPAKITVDDNTLMVSLQTGRKQAEILPLLKNTVATELARYDADIEEITPLVEIQSVDEMIMQGGENHTWDIYDDDDDDDEEDD